MKQTATEPRREYAPIATISASRDWVGERDEVADRCDLTAGAGCSRARVSQARVRIAARPHDRSYWALRVVGDTFDRMHVVRSGGLAAVVCLVASGCGGLSHTSSAGGSPASHDAGPPTSNERVLTREQSQRLVDWTASLRSCLLKGGFAVGKPSATSTEIELPVSGSAQHQLVQATFRCGDSLGGPPASSSVQTFPSRIVMYLPKQCLLDPKVARGNA
jgi:hypothetical protein